MTSVPPPQPPWRPELPAGVLAPPPAAPGAGRGPGLRSLPWWAPVAAFLGAIFAGVIAYLVAVGFVGWDTGPGGDPPPGVLVPATLVQDVTMLVLAVVFVRSFCGPDPLTRLGFRRTPPRRAVGWALVGIVGFWIAAGIVGALAGDGGKQDLVKSLEREDSLLALVGFGALTVIGAPLAEETLFRGMIFGKLRDRLPVGAAALLTGAMFAVVHLPAPGQTILVLAVLGALLCMVYAQTGSLIPCFACHAVVNSVTFAVTKHVTVGGGFALVAGSVGVVVAIGTLAARPGR